MKGWPLLGGLTLAVLFSALAVIYAQHLNRQLFVELQQLVEARDAFNVEWGQLALEQSTFSTHSVIERKAREQLQMSPPKPADVVMVKP